MPPVIALDHGPGGRAALFTRPSAVLLAWTRAEVADVLDRAEAARRAGQWVAGYIAYEAGYAFEPRLSGITHHDPRAPLVALGVFDAPGPAAPFLEQADAQSSSLSPILPRITRGDYAQSFSRLMDYIAAGDCYQANLTFPLAAQLVSGSAAGLYGALRARQSVGFGAYLDLGAGPVVLSCSPELFFTLQDGVVESRPMKGTAPRGATPDADRALRDGLATSEKVQAENLMIVDLLRNDIARISEVGSVKVPELFEIDSFATVHQMSSRIRGRLRANLGLTEIMAALFPCGSVTGAPKIRAMQIIAELERTPRSVYCGAIGWAGPDGDQAWSVAIRTLRLFEGGAIEGNVGGGIVQDSTEAGEWEEALWKTRFATGLRRAA
ncbi:Aminodeoxychorismate synthase component 1 [Roseibaca ekhonensis]|jgi:para-aminobenzoate synthetase component 1|uniref:Aminodeoxychorismate synthase component 1 n=1 Tax=Roseinatronobacter ekhonensis TaxID=254356 RepID=A0A3B0M4G0_9RHOB|nr:aminodeoxychorismate synthase component I [Roseibaca ekhonensis]SUZ30430.1 Aminodeoxychorismate synthase component 1 [Roseibaca ekhonensis]